MKMVLSLAVIAVTIDKSGVEVNRWLLVLVGHGYVERVKRGYYEISEAGENFLAGEGSPAVESSE